jgi:uncharacterized protein YbbC (DUF1343 family)
VRFRPIVFTPMFQKFARKRCGGLALHVVSRRDFLPYLTGVAIIRAFRHMFPREFRWRTREYEFVSSIPAIDLLAGGPALREGIDAGLSLEALAATWRPAEIAFHKTREKWLLYS